MLACDSCGGSLPSTSLKTRSIAASEYSHAKEREGRVSELEVVGVARGEGLRYCCASTNTVVFLATKVRQKGSSSERIVVGPSNIEALIHSKFGRLVTRGTVVAVEDGAFEIHFNIPNPGTYQLSIRLYQQQVKGSPFAVECLTSEQYSRDECSFHSAPISKSNSSSSHNSLSSARALRPQGIEDDLILRIGRKGRGRGLFLNPQDVTCLPDGRLIASDSSAQMVQVFSAEGKFRCSFGIPGPGASAVRRPVGLASLGRARVAVADYDAKSVSIFDLNDQPRFIAKMGAGRLLGPKGVVADADSNLFIIDNKGGSILRYSGEGRLQLKFGRRGTGEDCLAGPHYAALDSKGRLFVTDFHHHAVKVFDAGSGEFLFSFGSSGEGNGQFNAPTGITIDTSDNVFVADWGNNRIQVFDSSGSFLSFVSSSSSPLFGPQGLAMSGDGAVAVADSGSHAVKLYRYQDSQ